VYRHACRYVPMVLSKAIGARDILCTAGWPSSRANCLTEDMEGERGGSNLDEVIVPQVWESGSALH